MVVNPLLELGGGQPSGGDMADERERDGAVGVDAIHGGQVRLVEYRDLHFVLQPYPVAVRVHRRRRRRDGDCPDGGLPSGRGITNSG